MTLLILLFTSVISVIAFRNNSLMRLLQFNSYLIWHKKEFYRLITHGLVHADWMHLIINMLVFYSFGISVERILNAMMEGGWIAYPKLDYLILYISAIIVSSLVSLFKHRNNFNYNSVGASGAVSSIVFFSIFFSPWEKVYFYGVIGLPGIILGAIYLIYSYYMGKKGMDNINHDAHFVGAVYGFVFPLLIDTQLFDVFLKSLIN